MTAATADRSSALLELAERLDQQQGYADAIASLSQGHGGSLGGVWGSASALVAANLTAHAPGTLVVFARATWTWTISATIWRSSRPSNASAFRPGNRRRARRASGRDLRRAASDAEVLLAAPPKLVVTSIQALLQPVPSPERSSGRPVASQGRRHRPGRFSALARNQRISEHHGRRTARRIRRRGGILDIFAADWIHPVRIELFGDKIESIRRFEVATQRSLASLDEIDITVSPPGQRSESISPRICRHKAGSYLSSRRTLRKRAATTWSGSSGRRTFTISTKLSPASISFRRSPRPPSPVARWKTTCHLGSNRSNASAATSARSATSWTPWRTRRPGGALVCQTEAEVQRLREISRRHAIGGSRPAAFSHRPPAGRLSPGDRPHRAGQRQRAVSSRRSASRLARRLGPRDRQLSRAARGRLRRPPLARHRPLPRPEAA